MSKLSPNLKPYTLDETISIMDSRANCSMSVKIDVSQAHQIIHQLLYQIIEDNKTPCHFSLYGRLIEGRDIDDEESEVEEDG
jgi:hypothetical protein